GAAPAQSGSTAQPAAMGTGAAAGGMALTRVQSLIGTNVVGANGRDAGEVENLLIDRSGMVRAAVVEWGGFLGIGARRAVVPIDQIRLGANNERARMELTREQLEALPRYEPNRLQSYGRDQGWGDGVRLYR
ncbi:MAG: PRC-barrel domain-containing protein, partial [Acetobacteraceae bacterium]|nr:PRC-barrel domain-containing protein [Acetobacteraceae bacterium]